jgi:hypothetical protein
LPYHRKVVLPQKLYLKYRSKRPCRVVSDVKAQKAVEMS